MEATDLDCNFLKLQFTNEQKTGEAWDKTHIMFYKA